MGDPFEEEPLPEGVTAEMVEALVVRVGEACEKIGLHATGDVHVEAHGGNLVLIGNFVIGDLAFSQRVQNPEQAQFDDQFRAIEADSVMDDAEEMRRRFKRQDPPNED